LPDQREGGGMDARPGTTTDGVRIYGRAPKPQGEQRRIQRGSVQV
jgi:hypothetical protein